MGGARNSFGPYVAAVPQQVLREARAYRNVRTVVLVGGRAEEVLPAAKAGGVERVVLLTALPSQVGLLGLLGGQGVFGGICPGAAPLPFSGIALAPLQGMTQGSRTRPGWRPSARQGSPSRHSRWAGCRTAEAAPQG